MATSIETPQQSECPLGDTQGKEKRHAPVCEETQRKLELMGVKQAAEVEAKHIDVVSLLSNNGETKFLVRPSDGVQVSLDSLRDKYLLICCVSLSLTYRNQELAHYQKFIKVYPGLVHRSGNAFEMVIVANNDGSLADFDHFFSGFPGLTIPFIDSVSRANVCAFMGLTSRTNKPMIGMILDKSHKVLQDNYCGDCFLSYGADFYPFTYEKAKVVDEMHSALEERFEYSGYYSQLGRTTCVSLTDLLGCEPSFKLKRTRGGDRYEEISILDMSKKNCVGVYLFSDGRFMSELASMYHQCIDKKLEFEIIMVCLSWFPCSPSPEDIEGIQHDATEFGDLSSFWLYPCTYETNCLLKSLCVSFTQNGLLIVRPGDKGWENMGKAMVRTGGISSYPFTRELILDRLTSFTVYSLLGGDSQTLTRLPYKSTILDLNLETTVAHLRDKNVLVYFDCPKKLWYARMLLDACRDNSVPDLEVVYVPVGSYDTSLLESCTKELSHCLMLPPQFAQMAAQRAFTPVEVDDGRLITIVAFGKDGRLRSRRAQFYLTNPPDEIASLFAGDSLSQVEAAYLGQVVEDHLSGIYRPFEQEEIYP